MIDPSVRISHIALILADLADQDEVLAATALDELEAMLDVLRVRKLFGEYGELDPRGDFRHGEYSVYRIEGIDD